MPKQQTKYRALHRVWHSKQERYYEPGEIVDLSHLTPDEREMLGPNGMGGVEPVTDEEAKQADTKSEGA